MAGVRLAVNSISSRRQPGREEVARRTRDRGSHQHLSGVPRGRVGSASAVMIGPTSITSRSEPTTPPVPRPGRRAKERGVGLPGLVGETRSVPDRGSRSRRRSLRPRQRDRAEAAARSRRCVRPARSSIQKASSPSVSCTHVVQGPLAVVPQALGGDRPAQHGDRGPRSADIDW